MIIIFISSSATTSLSRKIVPSIRQSNSRITVILAPIRPQLSKLFFLNPDKKIPPTDSG